MGYVRNVGESNRFSGGLRAVSAPHYASVGASEVLLAQVLACRTNRLRIAGDLCGSKKVLHPTLVLEKVKPQVRQMRNTRHAESARNH